MACAMTKKYLCENNVQFESIDVMQNEEALNRIKNAGYSSMPVVVVEDNFINSWNGFRPDDLERIAGYAK